MSERRSKTLSVRLERRASGVAWIVVERPEARNAMTVAMWQQVGSLLDELVRADGVRAVVFGGTPSAFVAGADIAEFQAFAGAEEGLAYESAVESILDRVEALPLPVIAAVGGPCTGGGALLACACDVRLGATSARVGIPVARTVGNVTTAKNLARLAAVIGLGRAKEWFLTARLHDAESAWRAGFFSELAGSNDALLERAQALGAELAACAPLTLAATKELARRLMAAQVAEVDDRALLARCYGSDDFREGVAAFLEKRVPRFRGR
ncbi:MAG: enoyl-CoA hydratase [Vulcanimicrobiaceae bacterium]